VPKAKPNAPPSNAPGHHTPAGKTVNHIPTLEFGILSISAVPEDHYSLSYILNESHWRIVKSRTCREAITRLSRRYMPVVICASDLPDGTWRDVLDQISTLAQPPVLIVTSRLADDYLWGEVLNLGGYNVLAKPFRESEVKHVVAGLWMNERRTVHEAAAAGVA
jgi:DNA-binding response OmpR family regulator